MHDESEQRLDHSALKVWRLMAGIASVIIVLFILSLVVLAVRMNWLWIFPAVASVIALILIVFLIVIIPSVRWNTWRYKINEQEIYLRYGILVVSQTQIPMVRVQHVDTKQGPILRRYNLATTSISTAAGFHDIPALPLEKANDLRGKIIRMAGIADDV